MKPGLALKSFRVWARRKVAVGKMDVCAHANPPTVRALFLSGTGGAYRGEAISSPDPHARNRPLRWVRR